MCLKITCLKTMKFLTVTFGTSELKVFPVYLPWKSPWKQAQLPGITCYFMIQLHTFIGPVFLGTTLSQVFECVTGLFNSLCLWCCRFGSPLAQTAVLPVATKQLHGPSIHNSLRAKFFRENINIYLHFVSYLHIDTTQVVEILPQIRQEPTYFT